MSSFMSASPDSDKMKRIERTEKRANISAALLSIACSLLTIFTIFVPSKASWSTEAEIPLDSIEVKHLGNFENDDGRLSYTADLMNQGHDREAIEFLNEFLKSVESDSEIAVTIHFNLGLAHFHLEEWNEAVTDFAIAADQAHHPDAYYNLGVAKMNLNENESALESLNKALALWQKPEYVAARDAVLSRINS